MAKNETGRVKVSDIADLHIPAVYADRFILRSVSGGVIRIAFAEDLDFPNIRQIAAVVISPQTAQDLSTFLKQVLQENGLWVDIPEPAEPQK
jgi:hypothetical protein